MSHKADVNPFVTWHLNYWGPTSRGPTYFFKHLRFVMASRGATLLSRGTRAARKLLGPTAATVLVLFLQLFQMLITLQPWEIRHNAWSPMLQVIVSSKLELENFWWNYTKKLEPFRTSSDFRELFELVCTTLFAFITKETQTFPRIFFKKLLKLDWASIRWDFNASTDKSIF